MDEPAFTAEGHTAVLDAAFRMNGYDTPIFLCRIGYRRPRFAAKNLLEPSDSSGFFCTFERMEPSRIRYAGRCRQWGGSSACFGGGEEKGGLRPAGRGPGHPMPAVKSPRKFSPPAGAGDHSDRIPPRADRIPQFHGRDCRSFQRRHGSPIRRR